MKRSAVITLTAALLLLGVGTSAHATEVGYNRKFGLGFILGDPTGITGKYWISGTNALDFGLGFTDYGFGYGNCYVDNQGFQHCSGYYDTSVNIDYLWQSKLVRSGAQLDWYIGLGGRAYFLGDRNYRYGIDFAARAPIGLALMFTNPSFLELFFEIAPAIRFLPPHGALDGGLGARFYF